MALADEPGEVGSAAAGYKSSPGQGEERRGGGRSRVVEHGGRRGALRLPPGLLAPLNPFVPPALLLLLPPPPPSQRPHRPALAPQPRALLEALAARPRCGEWGGSARLGGELPGAGVGWRGLRAGRGGDLCSLVPSPAAPAGWRKAPASWRSTRTPSGKCRRSASPTLFFCLFFTHG